MKDRDKKFPLLLGLFVASTAASWSLYFGDYRQTDTVNIHRFPMTINEWTGRDMIITEEEYEILETRNAFSRKYTNPLGDEVYLFVVYSQNNRKVSHPPEICYAGSGASIVSSERIFVGSAERKERIQVNRMVMDQKKFQQVIYYWFKVGSNFTANYWHQQFIIGMKSLLGKRESSALIRISSVIKSKNLEKTSNVIEGFTSDMSPLILKFLP